MTNTKILLVEDNAINQLIVSTCLRKWGMMVTVANHGKEALVLIQSRDFQLVLMDLQMPEMDGYESTSKIRSMEDPYFKTVPIISFSASSLIDTKEKALKFGMTDFIGKPLMMDELRTKIDTYTMNTPVQSASALRPLFVDFKLHADNDPDFKLELIELMIANLEELKKSFEQSRQENKPDIYQRSCHKVKVSLTLLNDQEFTDITEKLKSGDVSQDKVDLFNKLCDDLMKSLAAEKNTQVHG